LPKPTAPGTVQQVGSPLQCAVGSPLHKWAQASVPPYLACMPRRRLPLVALPLLLVAPAARAQPPAVALTLRDAIVRGRDAGIQALVAANQARIAGRRADQRRAEVLPSVTGTASVTRQTLNLDELGVPQSPGVTDPFTVWRFRGTLTQTVFDAAAFARLGAARDSVLAAGLDARAAGELAGTVAGLAWIRLASADATVRARAADSAIAASLLEQARALAEGGLTPAIDVTRNEVTLATARGALEVARHARDRARLDLLLAVDLPPAAGVTLVGAPADSLPFDLPSSPDSAAAEALARRAEVAAERQRTAVAEAALRAVKLELAPSLAGSAFYQGSGTELDAVKGSYNLQLGVSWPVFDGLRRQARAGEQALRLEVQRLRQRDVERRVEVEARQAALDLQSAAVQLRLARERLALAEAELAQAQDRFAAGVAGSLETTRAQGAVAAARDAVIQAEVARAAAAVTAARALGALADLPTLPPGAPAR